MLTVERVDDTGFRALATAWDELLSASGSDSLFLTWEWLYAWWTHRRGARRLFLLAVRDGHDLVALAPFALVPPRLGRLPFGSVQLLGADAVGSDYLDLIVRRGCEEPVVQVLAERLGMERPCLDLRQLGRGALVWRLADRMAQRGWMREEATTEVCPFVPLAGHDWPSYLASLGAAHRYNFQRRWRNLQRAYDARVHVVAAEEERGPALDRLIALHQTRWRDRGRSEAFASGDLVAFHHAVSRSALARGRLRLMELRLDGRPAAAWYGFRYRDAFLFYQSGFDSAYGRHSVGLVMMGLAVRAALEEGAAEFDLLHGGEPYKFLWAARTRELRRVELYPPRWQGYVSRRWMALGRAVRRAAGQPAAEVPQA